VVGHVHTSSVEDTLPARWRDNRSSLPPRRSLFSLASLLRLALAAALQQGLVLNQILCFVLLAPAFARSYCHTGASVTSTCRAQGYLSPQLETIRLAACSS